MDITTMQFKGYKDHGIQQAISKMMANVTVREGKQTLAELGYLHMNSLSYKDGHLQLDVYFDPRLACDDKHGSCPRLNIFRNYLFAGDVHYSADMERRYIQKAKIKPNALGHDAIVWKDKAEDEERMVLVLHCNIYLALAAAFDIRLDDPNYAVSFDTDKDARSKKDRIMICGNAVQEYPVSITITKTDGDEYTGYDPELAIDYLKARQEKLEEEEQSQKELQKEIKKKSKAKRREERESSKRLGKFM